MAPNWCDGHTASDTQPQTHIPMQIFIFTRVIQVTGRRNFHLFIHRSTTKKIVTLVQKILSRTGIRFPGIFRYNRSLIICVHLPAWVIFKNIRRQSLAGVPESDDMFLSQCILYNNKSISMKQSGRSLDIRW